MTATAPMPQVLMFPQKRGVRVIMYIWFKTMSMSIHHINNFTFLDNNIQFTPLECLWTGALETSFTQKALWDQTWDQFAMRRQCYTLGHLVTPLPSDE